MTTPLVWTEKISVNIPEIDQQHQTLFAIINDLITEHNQQAEPEKILSLIGRLVDYSGTHFTTEENLLVDLNFPHFIQHNQAHLAYMKKVDLFIQDCKSNKRGLSLEMLEFLNHWWLNHVSISDMEYARHFKANPAD
ncbi:bacteriohemerythrin [Desulfoluna sp.]|uniref:bacteriohemerythrin n=1 Tax=Desulfoluna sp. TaxID=2045199 RepID=UPI002610CD49|nr:bacteriohemerythrin [Desulfoluna sp.]